MIFQAALRYAAKHGLCLEKQPEKPSAIAKNKISNYKDVI
ncbi:hypothetical protein SAMN02746062_00454 [Alysiella filiformis DSM 16848]|uniref:Uncharacterized protein n=1 Tax=Alysiella filiformis DSM 16848 TaxID=1120981 RepID=A0A286E4Z3_9NEIS|nr:hypothetical protein SAMN02746062_00454 [Alysiella filiformis DSM 16848]